MNRHEVRGGARYVGGKVETAIGDMVDRRDWQVAGIVDQVSGASENFFGRAQSVAGSVADATPALIEEAKERAHDASARVIDAARDGSRAAIRIAHRDEDRLLWAAAAAIGGYVVGWLIHRRAR